MSMTDKTSSRLTHTLSPSQGQREIGLPGTSDRCLSPPSLPEGEGATRSCRRHEPLRVRIGPEGHGGDSAKGLA
jgi:hypothetical protein